MSFKSLSLSDELIHSLPTDIHKPTDIQALVIPQMLADNDVLALANTGSGKTLAYTLPLLEKLKLNPEQQALVLVPTRELATQVSKVINQLASPLGFSAECLCGGVDKSEQQQALEQQPQILVATTGRLIDLINDGLSLSKVVYLVLDEADRLLDMGFWPDVKTIAGNTNLKRQTAMFSATFSESLKQQATTLMRSAIELSAHQKNSTNSDIAEYLYLVNKGSKTKALIELIKQHQWSQVLVFIGAKDDADALSKKLKKAGIDNHALHGNKDQTERESALAQFKSGESKVLIATDLLARGVHIDQLPAVVNFELPMHAETYVHRVGRTARAGEKGMAISLVCHGETEALQAIRNLTKRELTLAELAGFPVTDKPSTGESKRAPRDKKANRRTNSKKSIKQFQGKAKRSVPRGK